MKEEELLKFWEEKKIFEKSLKNPAGDREFVFYDGPPFATGLPHYGHILASAIKDTVPRYQTMRGKRVARRWGWDCHGLPIETIVEKELSLKSKNEIEKTGVAVFNEKARSKVLEYVSEWKKTVRRMARWVDFDGAYKTMDNSYIESVWWAIKEIEKKGLLYEGKRVLLYCPRCETPVSKAEVAMDNSYRDVTEEAVTVRFELADEPGKYLEAWTTTPWTLPANSGLGVRQDGPFSSYIGREYRLLYGEGRGKIVAADFVTADEGTGVVHLAPAYGEEDYAVGVREELALRMVLDARGHFTSEAPDFLRGQYFKKANGMIIDDLKRRNLLVAAKAITHSYPHCWRCDTTLIYNAVSAWFVKIQESKNRLLELNEKANWIPTHLKEGRFRKIVEGAPDWNISRNRYWASPLPIWKCDACSFVKVVGSVAALGVAFKNDYFLMRHGGTNNNKLDLVSARPENPDHLTNEGKEEAEKTATGLKDKGISLIFASDFARAKETAEIAARALGISREKIVYDPRLREVAAIPYEGRSWAEYHANPAGELASEVKSRMEDFFNECEDRYRGEKILVVSHGAPLKLLSARWMKGELATGEAKNLQLDLHRPYVDAVTFDCEACGPSGVGKMKRVPEVVDCWIESAAMPFAAAHYPFENKEWFAGHFPADFVAEYIAQTRTWFYYSFVLSTILFDDLPFKNIVTTGTILSEDGSKMSKSRGNFPDPWIIFEKYGSDALRFYLISSQVMKAEDLNFSESGVDEVNKKFITRLANVLNFYELNKEAPERALNSLDQWMQLRLEETLVLVTESMDRFELDLATRPLLALVEDLSLWYIRRSRKNFSPKFTRNLLKELAKLLAPFVPFMAENIYQKVREESDPESVHLESWSVVGGKSIKSIKSVKSKVESILEEMEEVRKICSLGLEARAGAGVKVRQPLGSLKIKKQNAKLSGEFIQLIKEEVNVKEVIIDPSIAGEIELDLTVTPELKLEGECRDLVRLVQDKRKELRLDPKEAIDLKLSPKYAPLLARFEKELKEAVNAHHVTMDPNTVDFYI